MRWRGMGWGQRGLSGGSGEGTPSVSCPFCFCGRLGRLAEGPTSAAAAGGRRARRRVALFCRRCSGGGCLGLCGPLFRPFLCRCTGGWKGAAVSAAGFLGDFCAPFEGRFARRGEMDANDLLAGGMMGSLALSLAGGSARAAAGALPFCPAGEHLGGGGGCRALCRHGEKGLSGMDGESAAPAQPRRGARRRGDGVGDGWGESAWPQLPTGGADGGLPMEKGAAVCYND